MRKLFYIWHNNIKLCKVFWLDILIINVFVVYSHRFLNLFKTRTPDERLVEIADPLKNFIRITIFSYYILMGFILLYYICSSQNSCLGNPEKHYIPLRPVVSYACFTWATTAGDANWLNIFERKVLRKIYGPVYNPYTQVWRSNEQVQHIYIEKEV